MGGPAEYTAYMFVQYVLGPEYVEYRAVTPLHPARVTLSLGLTLWSWSLSRTSALPAHSSRGERFYSAVMLSLVGFVVLRYTGGLVGSFSSRRSRRSSPTPAPSTGPSTCSTSASSYPLASSAPSRCCAVASWATERSPR